jgi:hypothetical protein
VFHPFAPLALAGSLLGALALQAQNPVLPIPPAPLLERQDFHAKLQSYVVTTLGPRALFIPGISALRHTIFPPRAYPSNWREGPQSWGRNYANALVSRSSRETGRFLVGALLHEDFRYRSSTSTNPWARGLHALTFTVVDKSDSGQNRVALANFAGAGAAGFVGSMYLPPRYNNLSHAEIRSATAFAGFAFWNLWLEFAPEALRLKHKLHVPFNTDPVPKWWTKRD